jgi:DNA polymerase-3 subunit epsilon
VFVTRRSGRAPVCLSHTLLRVYAVIDLETTGLNPLRHDRIAEIAVVHLDAGGTITREWCTLVNPLRDLGPQRIHGIRAADARRAPTFAALAPQIAGLLRGRVLVAHNVAFDGPFLAHQFRLLGVNPPIATADTLCTMQLAATFLPTSGRSLAACCATAGVPLEHAHCALDDARAAALLLAFYLRTAGTPPPWTAVLTAAQAAAWPDLPDAHHDEVRRPAADAVPPHFLSRLVDRLPRVTEPVQADSYLALLDRALIDRRISATESDALVTAAAALRLSRADVLALHAGYLTELATAALSDGTVSDAERDDLLSVAGLLGLPAGSVDRALAANAAANRPPRQRWELHTGDEVVFTGDDAEPREVWERRALEAGLSVAAAVTTTTRLLVAADVDTMSVKARRADTYGVPIVDLATFLEMVRRHSG